MRIDVLTLFPEFVEGCAGIGVIGRAQERGLLQVQTWNPRDYATDAIAAWTSVPSVVARVW